MPRDKTELTDYQKKILALEPKRENYPLADDEEWEEIRAGFRHRTAHILRPRAPLSTGSPKP
tara:strand:- start:285 stop:470 length:186 start_codon:yes stop_codon:yes gene_type:complete